MKALAILARSVVTSLVLALGSASAQAPLDLRIALVIGNSAYAGAAALPNPAKDAKAMSDTLRGLGFDVVEVRDASRAQMLEAVQKVRDTLRGKQGIGMLYYAGHGLQLDWRNYMVPVDAKLEGAGEVPQQTVDVATVLEAFGAAGNRMNILVLDACRENPFKQSASGRGLAQMDAPPSTILAYATSPGGVADDGDGANGLYTQFLLRELVKPQSKIEDVFKRTRFAVRKASQGRQVPWESTSLEEDFMFNAGQVAAVPKPDARQRESGYLQEKGEWDRVAATANADDLFAFLARYPSGNFSDLAQSRLEQLQRARITPQPARDGTVSIPFAERHRDGDRYEMIWKDGLTGATLMRQTFEIRPKGAELVEAVVVSGPGPTSVLTRSGYTIQDIYGTYDPPLPVIAGGEFKLGNRASVRTRLTEPSGNQTWMDFEGRTVARETLQLPFGSVATYRIEATSVTPNGHKVTTSVWYDPDWGLPMRIRLDTRRPGSSTSEVRIREVVVRTRKS